ncbi:hypothetical protein BSL82_09675 [Tardibacter chloracetimidivorans]|uniref:SPOR domain-containing protein n=1 Tax=Tardibacter chloracetimidivorans TaxID=1921510 RepID=A0A1L3ZVC7_9SPHN|nr:hypothetical protein [Tardibacter chloracetimidivorans]API59550.1 hypothetical protein BSL82_09675 [Tardibacter chloracetimidivorans]
MSNAQHAPYTVELAIHYNGRFAGWQEFGPFADKREAWAFIQSHGFTEAQKDDEWMAYPAGRA